MNSRTRVIAAEDDAGIVAWSWTNEYGGRSLIEWDVAGTFEAAPAVRTATRPDEVRTAQKLAACRRVGVGSEGRIVIVPREDRGL